MRRLLELAGIRHRTAPLKEGEDDLFGGGGDEGGDEEGGDDLFGGGDEEEGGDDGEMRGGECRGDGKRGASTTGRVGKAFEVTGAVESTSGVSS